MVQVLILCVPGNVLQRVLSRQKLPNLYQVFPSVFGEDTHDLVYYSAKGVVELHRESVSDWGGFNLKVLIASCTANSNFILEFSETLRVASAPAPRRTRPAQRKTKPNLKPPNQRHFRDEAVACFMMLVYFSIIDSGAHTAGGLLLPVSTGELGLERTAANVQVGRRVWAGSFCSCSLWFPINT